MRVPTQSRRCLFFSPREKLTPIGAATLFALQNLHWRSLMLVSPTRPPLILRAILMFSNPTRLDGQRHLVLSSTILSQGMRPLRMVPGEVVIEHGLLNMAVAR